MITPEEGQTTVFQATIISLLVITFVAIVLRVISRVVAKLGLWWDDYLVLLSEVSVSAGSGFGYRTMHLHRDFSAYFARCNHGRFAWYVSGCFITAWVQFRLSFRRHQVWFWTALANWRYRRHCCVQVILCQQDFLSNRDGERVSDSMVYIVHSINKLNLHLYTLNCDAHFSNFLYRQVQGAVLTPRSRHSLDAQ